MKILHEFGVSECPKCKEKAGVTMNTCRFILDSEQASGGFLMRTCRRCGYFWDERTADHKDTPEQAAEREVKEIVGDGA